MFGVIRGQTDARQLIVRSVCPTLNAFFDGPPFLIVSWSRRTFNLCARSMYSCLSVSENELEVFEPSGTLHVDGKMGPSISKCLYEAMLLT